MYRYEFGDGGHAAGLNDGMDMVPAPIYPAQTLPSTISTPGAATSGLTSVAGTSLPDTTVAAPADDPVPVAPPKNTTSSKPVTTTAPVTSQPSNTTTALRPTRTTTASNSTAAAMKFRPLRSGRSPRPTGGEAPPRKS